ncbi:MAG TPA: hypothetical protein VFX16_17270 [Pseudonocardiaceae bacterium]|nr:hypothetical protein [Pseudonocardiaceae bacterium]
MRSRWARIGIVTAVAVTVTAGSAVATAGLADGAAAPVVIGSCATTVKGDPGTPVELSPSAVLSPVVSIVQTLDPLNLLTPGFRSAFAALPPIPIGALPTGTSTITGGQIANAVAAQLNKIPLLGPILSTLTGKVQSTLAGMCEVTVTGVDAVTAPVQDGTASIATAANKAAQQAGIVPTSGLTSGSGSTPGKTGTTGGSGGGTPVQQSGGGSSGSGLPAPNSPVLGGLPPGLGAAGTTFGPGALLDYGLAESPLARYAGISFASAGLFDPAPGVKYGGDVPGYAPSSGQLGQNDVPTPDGVQTAGHAEALNIGGALGNGVGLPMLLAVLLLAGVTAALVRTWVLRKVRIA